MKLKLLPLFLSLSTLSGCMTYSESFDCPPGKGVGCKSLSQVNEMVEEGDLPLETGNTTHEVTQESTREVTQELTRESTQEPTIPAGWIEAKNTSQFQNLRIWVAEYKDEEGNLHSPSYIYASLNANPDNGEVKENF